MGWWLVAIAVLSVMFLLRNYLPEMREDAPGGVAADGRVEESRPAGDTGHPKPAQTDQPRDKRRADEFGSDRNPPKLGELRSIGRGVYESAAGLRYGPGSREGHRLDHIMLHTEDEPNRPGSHGVFNGGKEETLRVIDEAYRIAQQRGPPTRVERDGERVIYTVDMRREIGFIGGQTGQRTGHPPVSHVRLVLEGNRIITAFPVEP